MTAADVNLQNLETGAAAAAFAAGQLDAVAVFAPFTTQALARPGSHALFTSKDYPGSIPDHLVVSGELADEHPDEVQKLVEAWFKTLDWIARQPGRGEADHGDPRWRLSSRLRVLRRGHDDLHAGSRTWRRSRRARDNKHLDHVAQQETTFLKDAGFIDADPDLTKMLMDKFVKAYAATASASP